MSPRRFLGWEAMERTTYEYDADGRLVSSTTTREPEWSDEQRDLVLAHMVLAADRCPGCGNRWSECTDPDVIWEVEDLTRCHACTEIIKRREASSAEQPQATYWFARKVTPDE